MVTRTADRETEARGAALVRLVGQARADGIRIYRNPRDGRHYASSASTPGRLHYVTGYSCDCLGFITHQRCKHLAALHAALGWIQPDPEPTPPAVSVSPCGECGGHGEIQDLEVRQHGRFVMQWTNCPTCHGTGIVVTTA